MPLERQERNGNIMEQVLYYGGPILTMEQPLYAEALLQQGGVIRAAGPLEALAAMAPGAKRVNLAGRALLPCVHRCAQPFFRLCKRAFAGAAGGRTEL